MTGLADDAARLLGGSVASAVPLPGGDLSGVALAHLRLFGDGYRSLVEALLDKAGV